MESYHTSEFGGRCLNCGRTFKSRSPRQTHCHSCRSRALRPSIVKGDAGAINALMRGNRPSRNGIVSHADWAWKPARRKRRCVSS